MNKTECGSCEESIVIDESGWTCKCGTTEPPDPDPEEEFNRMQAREALIMSATEDFLREVCGNLIAKRWRSVIESALAPPKSEEAK